MATAGATGALKKPLELATGIGGAIMAPATGGLSAAIPAAELALGTDTGKTIAGNTLRGTNLLGRVLSKAPDTSGAIPVGKNMLIPAEDKAATKAPSAIGGLSKNITSKTAVETLPRAFSNSQPNPNASPGVGGPVSTAVSSQVAQMTSQLNQKTNPTQSNPYLQQLTPDQVQQILQTSGIEGLRAIQSQQSDALAIQKQEQPELTQEQQTQILDATKALQGVADLSKMYEQVYATGAGAGTLSELGTHIPGIQNTKGEAALKTYDGNMGDLAATIANVLGSGRSSVGMINQIKEELPTATDSPLAAQQKFALVLIRLQGAMGATLAAPATNTPGQLTDFAGQSIPGVNTGTPTTSNLLNFLPPSMVQGY